MDNRRPDDPMDLSGFNEDYARLTTNAFGDSTQDDIPDGEYAVRIEEVCLTHTSSTGNPMLIWRLRILGPTHVGRSLTKMRVITTKSLTWVKSDLVRMGMLLDRFSDLPARKDEMLSRELVVMKRANTERGWVDINIVQGCYAPTRSDDVPF